MDTRKSLNFSEILKLAQNNQEFYDKEFITLTTSPSSIELGLMKELTNKEQEDAKLLYHVLLAMSKYATKQRNQAPEDIIKQTIKLITLFGDYKNALTYLQRGYHDYDGDQYLHDQCLFDLPPSNCNWNKELWRSMLSFHKPKKYNDPIMKILPFVSKIEMYVEQNYNSLREEIEKNVFEEKDNQYKIEFNQINFEDENDVEKRISVFLDKYKKEINQQFIKKKKEYLLEKFNINLDKIDYKVNYKELEEKLSHTEKNYLTEMEKEIRSQYKSMVTNSIKDLNGYIKLRKVQEQGTIGAIINSKAQNILSSKTSVPTLLYYASKVSYANSSKYPEISILYFSYNLTEESFDQYCQLVPKDDPEQIPDVTIQLEDISNEYKGFYIKKLSPHDPRAGILGKITNCCQYIGGAGESCAIYGITDPRSGFYVLCKKNQLSEEEIYSQCWVWRDDRDNIVFDSIESQMHFKEKNCMLICDAFTALAFKLVSEYQIKCVLVGIGGYGATPSLMGMKNLTPPKPPKPLNYDGYQTDSEKQSIVAINSQSLLNDYIFINPTSKLKRNFVHLNQSEIYDNEICDNLIVMFDFDSKLMANALFSFKEELNIEFIDNINYNDNSIIENEQIKFCVVSAEEMNQKDIFTSKTSFIIKDDSRDQLSLIYPLKHKIMYINLSENVKNELEQVFLNNVSQFPHYLSEEEANQIVKIIEPEIKNGQFCYDLDVSYKEISALKKFIDNENDECPLLTTELENQLIKFPMLLPKMFYFCIMEKAQDVFSFIINSKSLINYLPAELIYNSIAIAYDDIGYRYIEQILPKIDLKKHGENILLCALQHAAKCNDINRYKHYIDLVKLLLHKGVNLPQGKVNSWSGGDELTWNIEYKLKVQESEMKQNVFYIYRKYHNYSDTSIDFCYLDINGEKSDYYMYDTKVGVKIYGDVNKILSGKMKYDYIKYLLKNNKTTIFDTNYQKSISTENTYGIMEHWLSLDEWMNNKIKPFVRKSDTCKKTFEFINELINNNKINNDNLVYFSEISIFKLPKDEIQITKIANLFKNYIQKDDYDHHDVDEWIMKDNGIFHIESLNDYVKLLHMLNIQDSQNVQISEEQFNIELAKIRNNRNLKI